MYTVSKIVADGIYEFLTTYDNPDLLARQIRNLMPEHRREFRICDADNCYTGDEWLQKYLKIKFIEKGE